jgi:hypothetical protein
MSTPLTVPLTLVNPSSVDDPYLKIGCAADPEARQREHGYDRYDRYYSGDQPLTFLAPEVAAQVGDRLAPMVINWPETITDSVNRRVVNEGFLLGEGGEADDELWRIWTANEMHHEAPLGQVDALVHGKAFISVWGNDEDPATPLMSFESAHQVEVEYEPGTGDRVVRAAVKRWADEDTGEVFTTLYLPDRIIRYRAANSRTNKFDVDQVLPNPLGAVPIVPMVNRGRLLNRAGRSELASIAPIADGINKLATDMMVTSEFYQTPRRWATGIQVPVTAPTGSGCRPRPRRTGSRRPSRRRGWPAGRAVRPVPRGQPGRLRFGDPAADVGAGRDRWPAAGRPRAQSGQPGVGRGAPRRRDGAGAAGAGEAVVQRAGLRAGDADGGRAARGPALGSLPTEYSRMSCDWRDPATEAISQEMDAAVKGVTAGIYDIEAAQTRVGHGPGRACGDEGPPRVAASATAATADVEARMALAQRLQAEQTA